MNEKLIDDIKHLLQWYRLNYGETLSIPGELSFDLEDEETAPAIPVLQPAAVSREADRESLADPLKIHGDHPRLKSFYEEIRNCRNCDLSQSRKHFVFGMGNPQADIMFIGEAPGRDEDEQGFPFVGRAGKLLDKMLFALGLKREDIYIANVLKCRPPGNRDPLPDEVLQCEPYLQQQLAIIQPRVVVALGRIAAQVLLKSGDSLKILRESEHSYNGIPFIVTYHPAALLRNSGWKALAWHDLKKLKKHIAGEL
ncbi:MAG TPA: uracil-DNA glycosylase [Caldithrix abyssi]|uniref:Type-4 uracil-DNA glycosylase n=1 Tax=Caldithrix abyssi TaxID=187145 RepID=A0A7V1LXM0_CALAY|nr:uracil-DNA glycosylase [Caldithrix abyssi]